MAKILDFKANNTTAGTGSLTNVVGPDWTVGRASKGEVVDSSSNVIEVDNNVPRVDNFSGVKVLIEPSAIQIYGETDNLSGSSWTRSRVVVTGGTSSPDGLTNGWSLAQALGETNAGVLVKNVSIETGLDYVVSVYAKSGTKTFVRLRQEGSGGNRDTWFNLSNGTVGTNGDANTASIVDYGDGWYKCSIKYTSIYTSARQHMIYIADADGSTTVTDDQGNILVFKPNLKQESSASSNIQNSTELEITREADVITNTVPAGTAPITMTTWIDGVSDGGVAVNQGDPITMLNGTTSIEIDDSGATTTVEVEWVDSISPQATGNKIYRDDIEIADIANGVQFYSDPDAPVGTESKYEVQAHDGAGDETTQEVLGDNMDYITTASAGVDYFPQDNAAALSDDNSRGSWDNSRTQIEPIQGDATEGVNSIEMTVTASGSQRGELTITGLTIGQSYTFTWDNKAIPISGVADIRAYNWTGLVVGPDMRDLADDTTWASKTFTGEANATSVLMRFYTQGGASDGTGDKLRVDKFRVTDA